jgi:hypothetical protein
MLHEKLLFGYKIQTKKGIIKWEGNLNRSFSSMNRPNRIKIRPIGFSPQIQVKRGPFIEKSGDHFHLVDNIMGLVDSPSGLIYYFLF